jgi:integrase
MASISTDSRGNRRILFMGVDGRKKAIHLGNTPKKSVESLKVLVEELLVARRTGRPSEPHTLRKVQSLHPTVRERLETLELLDGLGGGSKRLGEFISEYVKGRTCVKPATKEIWRQGENSLIAYFGKDMSLNKVTPGDADEYLEHLRGTTLAPMTIKKRLQFAKKIFRAAARKKLIFIDPFYDVSFTATKPDKSFFVTAAMAAKLIDACPDHNWRMIVLLCRYGGLRCPSEVLSLRWQDILWDQNKIVVPSPKTEHHPGKDTRIIPLFPELRRQLEECFEFAAEGAVYVVDSHYRQSAMGKDGWRNCNLRTQFQRIVKNAGLTPWPRLFHNLRSSRQTELAETFPSHVVCGWLGNSEKIAREHYYQITDEHFASAAGLKDSNAEAATEPASDHHPAGSVSMSSGDANSDALPTQNPTQQAAAGVGTFPHDSSYLVTAQAVMQWHAALCGNVQNPKTDGVGFEPTSRFHDCRFSRPVHSTTLPPVQVTAAGKAAHERCR